MCSDIEYGDTDTREAETGVLQACDHHDLYKSVSQNTLGLGQLAHRVKASGTKPQDVVHSLGPIWWKEGTHFMFFCPLYTHLFIYTLYLPLPSMCMYWHVHLYTRVHVSH